MQNYKLVITWQDVNEFNNLYFAEHPRATKPRIKRPQHPSLNEYMIANNMKANQWKQNWKDFIVFLLEKYGLSGVKIDTCEVTYITYFGDKRVHDVDNITPKFIFDGLVEGGFLVADDIDHIKSLTTLGDRDRDNPRIELHFENVQLRKGE